MIKRNKILFKYVVLVSLFMLPLSFVLLVNVKVASAISLINKVDLDAKTIARGYAVKSLDTYFSLIVLPGTLKQGTQVSIEQLNSSDVLFPDNWVPASDIYEYAVDGSDFVNEKKFLVIDIKVFEGDRNQKRVFYWDEVTLEWKILPTEVRDQSTVRIKVSNLNGRLVVLEKPIMELGVASWYKYKSCDCAASPDYPKGTKLLVKNLENNKQVVVTVNDFGPDRSIFPDRVIDLDVVAFKKLGPLSRGVLKNIQVIPEPVLSSPKSEFEKL